MKNKNACGSRERERERESRNLRKIEEREGLYSLNRPLFICTTKLTQGRSVNDNASNILKMQSIRKNNSMKSILNAVSGITLIALVVTIVVLLILASVSITVVFGDNGILELAKEAGEKTNEAKDKDLRQIAMAEAVMNFENTKYKGVTIPAGFAPTRIEGEDSIDEGLVIIDSKGNEFVWVPVDGVEGEESVDAENGEKIIYKQDTVTWKEKQNNYNEYNDWWDEEEIEFRKKSVKDNGGFYVARYEAGVPESINYDENTNYKEKSNPTNRNKSAKEVTKENLPASRKGLQAWNYVSQTNAKDLSEKMYADSTSVTSRLIDSYAWDTICHWLDSSDKSVLSSSSWGNYKNADSGEGVNGLYSKHHETWNGNINNGNYGRGKIKFRERTDSLDTVVYIYELATGISERNKANNIYDFAGNMWEWTTEKGKHITAAESEPETKAEPTAGTIYAVLRGGCFHDDGDFYSVCWRYGNENIIDCVVNISFRPVLYLK